MDVCVLAASTLGDDCAGHEGQCGKAMVSLTWPMAKLSTFWDYMFGRENKVQAFISGFHWLSEQSTYTYTHRKDFRRPGKKRGENPMMRVYTVFLKFEKTLILVGKFVYCS